MTLISKTLSRILKINGIFRNLIKMHKENSKIKSTSKISDKGKRLSRIKFRKS